jgi:cytidine deaminase
MSVENSLVTIQDAPNPPRAPSTELVIAFVAAVGVNLEIAEEAVKQRLAIYNYSTQDVKVTRHILTRFDKTADGEFDNAFQRINKMMDIGTEARRKSGPDVIAKGIAWEIAARRKKIQLSARTAYLVHSLKHPDEVRKLREIYPNGFFLIGVHAHPAMRKAHLTKVRGMSEGEAKRLMDRDKKEDVKFGQQVNDTFHLSDFFVGWGGDDEEYAILKDMQSDDDEIINETTMIGEFPDTFENNEGLPSETASTISKASNEQQENNLHVNRKRVAASINRFVDIIFGHPHITPTFGEYAMFLAFTSALRSADLSRQVGAVVAKDGEILSTGANDCPSAGGGLYWPHFDAKSGEILDAPKGRDYMRGCDSNRVEQDELIRKIVEAVQRADFDAAVIDALRDVIGDSPIRSLTEYGRVVHAEMEALMACARKGAATKGATIYCTTFPCHNCAKHIIAAGIDRVVFVEPYLKSKAFQFHNDAIVISYPQNENLNEIGSRAYRDDRVKFEPFFGVGPRRFFDLFSTSLGVGFPIVRKSEQGKSVSYNPIYQVPRLAMQASSYLQREDVAAREFDYLCSC